MYLKMKQVLSEFFKTGKLQWKNNYTKSFINHLWEVCARPKYYYFNYKSYDKTLLVYIFAPKLLKKSWEYIIPSKYLGEFTLLRELSDISKIHINETFPLVICLGYIEKINERRD